MVYTLECFQIFYQIQSCSCLRVVAAWNGTKQGAKLRCAASTTNVRKPFLPKPYQLLCLSGICSWWYFMCHKQFPSDINFLNVSIYRLLAYRQVFRKLPLYNSAKFSYTFDLDCTIHTIHMYRIHITYLWNKLHLRFGVQIAYR